MKIWFVFTIALLIFKILIPSPYHWFIQDLPIYYLIYLKGKSTCYCFTNIKILNYPFKIHPGRSAPILSHVASRHARLAAQVTPRKARRVLRRWPPDFLGVSPKRSLGEGVGETLLLGVAASLKPEDFLGGFGCRRLRIALQFEPRLG